MASLSYLRSGNTLVIDHTEVPNASRRRGIGGRLAHAALEYARAGKLTVDPVCPFVRAYIHAHPEYESLVVRS
jgi:predicted GNAT family acetyltransferase